MEPTNIPIPLNDKEFFQKVFPKNDVGNEKRRQKFIDAFTAANQEKPDFSCQDYKKKFQFQKDEKAITLYFAYAIHLLKQEAKDASLKNLLERAELEKKPEWIAAPKITLEKYFPAPTKYCEQLRQSGNSRTFHPVRYVWERAKKVINAGGRLEGASHIDMSIEMENFEVLCEAKFTSDISNSTEYGLSRNQLARLIDIGWQKVDSKKSFAVLLITPKRFMNGEKDQNSRLYSYKFNEYKTNPITLARDLQHLDLTLSNCSEISKCIGWVSWEVFAQVIFGTGELSKIDHSFVKEFREFLEDRAIWMKA